VPAAAEWRLTINVTATGGTLDTAQVLFSSPASTVDMDVTGNTATYSVIFMGTLHLQKTWRVKAVATNGKTFTTSVRTTARPSNCHP
jgi:hypothetical protein